jgi:hypothetical protein
MRTYYHVIEDSSYGNIGSHGYYKTQDEAQKEVERLQSYYPNYFFYVYSSNTKKQPEFITL